jgi:hypothetical protein
MHLPSWFHSWHLTFLWPPVELFLYKKSIGLVWWIVKPKGTNIMPKSVTVGPLVLEATVSNGQAKLTANAALSESVGGGAAAGVVGFKAGVQIEADLGAQQAADLAIMALEAAFPSAESFLALVKAGVDAEIAKITI